MKQDSLISHYNRINPNIMVFILYGVLYETSYNMYRPFAVKFLERIGGTELYISLFYSIPGLIAALALLPGSLLLSRLKTKKNVTSILFLLGRLMIFSLLFLPLLPPALRPLLFIIIIGAMNLPDSLSQTSLQSFLGNVFSDKERAFAIATRHKYGNMTIMLITLLTGSIISYLPKTDADRLHLYQFFFALAFIVGIVEMMVFRRFKETPQEHTAKLRLSDIKTAFADKKFMVYLLTMFVFQFTWHTGWPLISIYQLNVIHVSEFWFAIFACTIGLSSFFSAGFWNRSISKHGNTKTLIFAALLMSINMLATYLSKNVWHMTLANAFSGFSTIGFTATLLNGTLLATPNENRIIYLGTFNTFVNLSLFSSTLFAAFLVDKFAVQNAMLINVFMRIFAGLLVFAVFHKKSPHIANPA